MALSKTIGQRGISHQELQQSSARFMAALNVVSWATNTGIPEREKRLKADGGTT